MRTLHWRVVTFLIRCAESGREQQARLGKLRHDLARVIAERLPDARIETAPGRVVVESEASNAAETLAGLPGVGTVSPCVRVSATALERVVVEHATSLLRPEDSFALRLRRSGPKAGAFATVKRTELAKSLANAITAIVPARVDLTAPNVEIGIELRGDEAFIFDQTLHGIDRTGPSVPAPVTGEPRFVADQMLGTLAVRLRLLGYDTLTVFDIADSEVTRLAAADGRILLTRDGPLALTRAVPVHKVAATEVRAQLVEVLDALGLTPDPERLFTRCTMCNTPVETVAASEVNDRLPASVRDAGLTIYRCAPCDQLYWRGTHVDRILRELA